MYQPSGLQQARRLVRVRAPFGGADHVSFQHQGSQVFEHPGRGSPRSVKTVACVDKGVAMEDERFPAGWYPDPDGTRGLIRLWDGATWTHRYRSDAWNVDAERPDSEEPRGFGARDIRENPSGRRYPAAGLPP
jgi:hypothetical protein